MTYFSINQQDNSKSINIVFSILLFFCIFGQRLVLPINAQIPIIFPIGIIGVSTLLLLNKFKLDYIRLILYTLFVSVAFLFSLFESSYSPTSFLYIVFLYFPFLIEFKVENRIKDKILRKFQNAVLFTSLFGISQFIFQLLGIEFFDPLSLIPSEFVQTGYNTTYPLYYDSPISKPNGGFYLEPSIFSQFLAIAIIVELIFFKRWTRILILMSALLLSFSGTGLLLLLLFCIPLLLKLKLKHILLLLTVGFIVSYFFFTSEFGTVTASRTQEYQSQNSSFSIRMLSPFKAVFDSNQQGFLIGHGAGQSNNSNFLYETNFTVIPKLWYEYGFFLMIIFMLFITRSVFYKSKNLLTISVFFMYLLLSGSLLQPQTVFFLYLITNIANIDYKPIKITKKSTKIILTRNFDLKIIRTKKAASH